MAEKFIDALFGFMSEEELRMKREIINTAKKLLEAAKPFIAEQCALFKVPFPKINLYFWTEFEGTIEGFYDHKEDVIRIFIGVRELMDEWHAPINRRIFTEMFVNCLFHELWHYIFYHRFKPTEKEMEVIESIVEESARLYGDKMQEQYYDMIIERAGNSAAGK